MELTMWDTRDTCCLSTNQHLRNPQTFRTTEHQPVNQSIQFQSNGQHPAFNPYASHCDTDDSAFISATWQQLTGCTACPSWQFSNSMVVTPTQKPEDLLPAHSDASKQPVVTLYVCTVKPNAKYFEIWCWLLHSTYMYTGFTYCWEQLFVLFVCFLNGFHFPVPVILFNPFTANLSTENDQ